MEAQVTVKKTKGKYQQEYHKNFYFIFTWFQKFFHLSLCYTGDYRIGYSHILQIDAKL